MKHIKLLLLPEQHELRSLGPGSWSWTCLVLYNYPSPETTYQ